MTVDELISLQHRLLYKNKQCFQVHKTFDPRNNNKVIPEGYVYISTWIHAMDVEFPYLPTRIENGGLTSIAELERMTIDAQVIFIKDQIMLLQLHEVQETLSLDNHRIFDPHSFSNTVIKQEVAA